MSFDHQASIVHLMLNMLTNTLGVREYKYNLKYFDIIKNMFGYEFSSRIVEMSTHNQVTGIELTYSLQITCGLPGYGLTAVGQDTN